MLQSFPPKAGPVAYLTLGNQTNVQHTSYFLVKQDQISQISSKQAKYLQNSTALLALPNGSKDGRKSL